MRDLKRVLDVGQCGVDGPRIGRFLTREFECTVDRAHSKEQALRMAAERDYDLILVNRVLDREGTQGVDVIRGILAERPEARVMLVSDIPEAQEEAVRLGALEGFGKSRLETPETESRICEILCGA